MKPPNSYGKDHETPKVKKREPEPANPVNEANNQVLSKSLDKSNLTENRTSLSLPESVPKEMD